MMRLPQHQQELSPQSPSHLVGEKQGGSASYIANEEQQERHRNNMTSDSSSAIVLEGRPQRRKKCVRFAPTVSVSTPLDPTSIEEIQQRWYTQEDLEKFKLESREQKAMSCPAASNYIEGTFSSSDEEEGEGERRSSIVGEGIGHCCKDRMKYSRMTIHCILSALKKGVSQTTLVAIATRCNAWTIEVAMMRAAQNYVSVYHPSMLPTLSAIPKIPKFPYSMMKRKTSTDKQPQKSVETARSKPCMITTKIQPISCNKRRRVSYTLT